MIAARTESSEQNSNYFFYTIDSVKPPIDPHSVNTGGGVTWVDL